MSEYLSDYLFKVNPYDFLYVVEDKPLEWQAKGLQQTATGYGAKLTTRKVVRLPDGRTRRVYCTCYANSCSCWITLGSRKIYLKDSD